MKLELAGGVMADLLSPAELDEHLQPMHERLHELRYVLERTRLSTRIYGSAVIDATGFGRIDLGPVPPGFIWEVRRLFVASSTLRSATPTFAGSAVAYRNEPAIMAAWDSSSNLPDVFTAAEGEFVLGQEERLVVEFFGVIAATAVYANGLVTVKATPQQELGGHIRRHNGR